MTPRCIRCHRPLTAAASVAVSTAKGALSVGPVCAKRMGLVKASEPRARACAVVRTEDEAQRTLFSYTEISEVSEVSA